MKLGVEDLQIELTDPSAIRIFKELRNAILKASLPSKAAQTICQVQLVANYAELKLAERHRQDGCCESCVKACEATEKHCVEAIRNYAEGMDYYRKLTDEHKSVQ